MKKPKRTRSTAWKLLVLGGLATLAIGCGGSDGDSITSTPSSGGGGNVVIPRTFQFPTFNNNSKLTVVANFQIPDESTNTTGQLSATLSGLSGAIAQAHPLSTLAARADSSAMHPCGFGEAAALAELTKDYNAQARVDPEVRRRFQELEEGAREEFVIIPAGWQTITAEKVLAPHETQHCTIFAEVRNGAPVIDRTKALMVAQAFDSNNPQRPGSGIYEQVRAVFGSEWNQNPVGGNDGDMKVVIFFFSTQTGGAGLFGFTSPADSNPQGGALSNKGEIIYVNAEKSDYQTLATISHEFQHLINQNEKTNQQGLNPSGAREENLTVNEGLSELAEEVCGFTLQSGNDLMATVCNDYLKKPQDHKFFNFSETGNGYGQGYLFFKYVREHFGDSVIRSICTNPETGLANLNAKLPLGFAETFRRWTIANYATNLTGPVPPMYTYPSGFKTNGTYPAGSLVGVATQSMENIQDIASGAIKPWSTIYLVRDGAAGPGLSIEILGAPNSPFGVLFEESRGLFSTLQQ